MNNVSVTFEDGTSETFTQDQIIRPKFDCCMSAEDYVARIMESGITTQVINPDGSVTTTRDGCVCKVVFTSDC